MISYRAAAVLLAATLLGLPDHRATGAPIGRHDSAKFHPSSHGRSGVRGAPAQQRELSLPEAREETAAASLGGRLYVIGGFDAGGQDTAGVFVYDGRAWHAGPPLPMAVDHTSAATLGGHLYVAGGFSSGHASNAVLVLASSGRAWLRARAMHHARGALALVAVGGNLYAVGGKDTNGYEIGSIEVYRPASRTWNDVGTLPGPRDHLAGFSYRGSVCVAGGRMPNTGRVDCYTPASHRWLRLPDLPTPTSGAGAASLGKTVVVGGGELATEGGTIIAQLAHLTRTKWSTGTMLIPRHGVQFAPFRGRIWACGGGIAPGMHPVSTCTSIRP
ncbi:MAG: hypothetical protein NVS4B2_25830 [Chloroflexota bacterium]